METQSVLEELAGMVDSSEGSDADSDVIDETGKRRKIFRRNNRSRSLTQPPHSALQLQIEDEGDNKLIIKMLKTISTQFTTFKKSVTRDMKLIKEDLKVIKEDVVEMKKDKEVVLNPDEINTSITVDMINKKVDVIEEKVDEITSSLSDKSQAIVERPSSTKGLKDRITVIKDIDEKIDKRRKAYYDQYQLKDRIQIHQEWLSQEPPIIPAAFIPKYIPKEPEKEYQIRKKQKINELNSKLEIWDVRAKEAEEKVKNYDDAVILEIDESNKMEEQKEIEKKAWLDLIKIEEERSQNIWKKKREDILAQPDRQKDRKKIQTIENKLYSTVVKENNEESENNNKSYSDSWQTVRYNNRKRNNYQYNGYTNRHYQPNWQPRNFHGKKPPNRYKRT